MIDFSTLTFFQEEEAKFFMLMNKAEKKNKKRMDAKKNQFGVSRHDWRNAKMNDPGEDTSDTEDDDDMQETNKFLSLMNDAQVKNTKVSIKWTSKGLSVEKQVGGLEGELLRREKERKQLEMQRRQEAVRRQALLRSETPSKKGKRKFADRMTLNEANLEDFEDTQDYVNFLQTKLQGVRIKIIKDPEASRSEEEVPQVQFKF